MKDGNLDGARPDCGCTVVGPLEVVEIAAVGSLETAPAAGCIVEGGVDDPSEVGFWGEATDLAEAGRFDTIAGVTLRN